MNKFSDTRGFSLVEAVIALSLGVAFLAGVMEAWIYTSDAWKRENFLFEQRLNIEKAMERIREDVRLSDANGILYFSPTGDPSFTAISLPHATPGADGLLAGPPANPIVWDSVICYHTSTNADGQMELRRTVFPNFYDIATRQNDLNALANDPNVIGEGTSTILFSTRTASLEIVPRIATFDGYSPTTSRSASTSFGSFLLAPVPGTYEIGFELTGKNAASSAAGIGIDSITLFPSGGPQEAEALTFSSEDGAPLIEDMSPFTGASWGGNEQVNFVGMYPGDLVIFETSYDQWLESNFSNMTYSGALATTGANPHLTNASRETQGLTPSWLAASQTNGVTPSNSPSSAINVRSIIDGDFVTTAGAMARIRFRAGDGSGNSLVINSAYFGPRSGSSENFSTTPIQLAFDNTPLAIGPDPIGSMNLNDGSNSTINIPFGNYVWSNWFPYTITTGTDYLVSMYISSSSNAASVWTGSATQSYQFSDSIDRAGETDWSSFSAVENNALYAVEFMATWVDSGTATSQVYDTRMSAPNYGEMSWDPVLPAGSSITMRIRTSPNPDMAGATPWSTAMSFTTPVPVATSPVSLTGLASQRYVQFQATLQMASPFLTFPELDNVKITWPGREQYVDISGFYTLGPENGIFKVLVRPKNTTEWIEPIRNLEITLTSAEVYKGKTYDFSLNTEQNSINTGK